MWLLVGDVIMDLDFGHSEALWPWGRVGLIQALWPGEGFKKDIKAILRDEFGYCTKVLGHKDPRLVVGSKQVDKLKTDFMCFLSEKSGVSVPTHFVELETSASVPTPCSRKRKRISSDSDSSEANDLSDMSDEVNVSLEDMEFQCSSSEDETEVEVNFKFCNQGVWVAVAYDEEFFIGQVIEVKSELCGCIQFMKMGYNQTFKWCGSEDIGEDIESMFVFHHGFEVVPRGSSGRLWSVPDLTRIEKMYRKYKIKFMAS